MNREEKLKDLIQKVEAWAEERNLIKFENADKQYLKFLEETGELARALLKNDTFEATDSWGDCLVTVVILAKQLKANLRMPTFDGKLVDPYINLYEFVNLVSPYTVAEETIDVMDLVAHSHGYDLVECLEVAYNVISKRKGVTKGGTFVKDDSISEQYLLDFGFTKVVSEFDGCDEVNYELETKDAFFVYSEDWSLAIADDRDTYENTGNYLAPEKELTNKVHLWQNIFKSLTGKDKYENQSIENY